MRSVYILSLLFLCGFCPAASAQKHGDGPLVQLSGLIKADEKTPIPYSTVRIRNSFRGTIAGVDGFYSIVVEEKDTVEYVALGYKTVRYIIPADPKDSKITKTVTLPQDTIVYEGRVPWQTEDEFKQAFLSLKLEEDAGDLARKNLDQQKLAELYETLARDGKENQIYTLQQIASSYYYAGGQRNYMMSGNVAIPASLLNPFAWVQFVDAIKKGRFRQKKD